MPNSTTIPADAIPGLLVGWTGPVDMLGLRLALPDEWVTTAYGNGGMANGADPKRLRLNCLRPEVQDHIGRVLAAGVRCAACGGRGSVRASVQPGCDGECPEPCGCDAGWTRKPSPIYHLTDAARTNALSPQHIAEAVAWSVRSVARGGEVLRGVVGPYYDAIDNGWGRVDIVGAGVSVGVYPRARENGQGWYVIFHGTDDTPDIEVSGPETGLDGRACADRAALAHNFALLNEDNSVTTPELSTETR